MSVVSNSSCEPGTTPPSDEPAPPTPAGDPGSARVIGVDVARGLARVAVSGGRDPGLVAARAAAGGRPARGTAADPACGLFLQGLAHTLELTRMLGTETPSGDRRAGTTASTSTTHHVRKSIEHTFQTQAVGIEPRLGNC